MLSLLSSLWAEPALSVGTWRSCSSLALVLRLWRTSAVLGPELRSQERLRLCSAEPSATKKGLQQLRASWHGKEMLGPIWKHTGAPGEFSEPVGVFFLLFVRAGVYFPPQGLTFRENGELVDSLRNPSMSFPVPCSQHQCTSCFEVGFLPCSSF